MDQPNPPAPGRSIQVDIDPAQAEGIYSNLAFLHSSPSELILDFARLTPGVQRAKVHSRIILTPQAAKGLARLLRENLDKWEKEHGEIRMPGRDSQAPIGFRPGGPSAPAGDGD